MGEKEIKLLKNNQKKDLKDIEWVDEFYEFLQGNIPEGIYLARHSKPKLTQKKAFAIIWYLQEHFCILPDNIERCDYCGGLYDSNSEGGYWESKGNHFCSGCADNVPHNYDRGKR